MTPRRTRVQGKTGNTWTSSRCPGCRKEGAVHDGPEIGPSLDESRLCTLYNCVDPGCRVDMFFGSPTVDPETGQERKTRRAPAGWRGYR